MFLSPALEAGPHHIGTAGPQVTVQHLMPEEKQGLRSAFGGSATFAVQCIAVESELLITVSKEVQNIVQGF